VEAKLENLKNYFELLVSSKKNGERREDHLPEFYQNLLKLDVHNDQFISAEFFFSRSSFLLSSSSSSKYRELSDDEDTSPFPYMIYSEIEADNGVKYIVNFELGMFVRKCYICAANNLCSFFLRQFGTDIFIFPIFGTSGTGKSAFGFYLIRRILTSPELLDLVLIYFCIFFLIEYVLTLSDFISEYLHLL
jgi:hypothetical protein